MGRTVAVLFACLSLLLAACSSGSDTTGAGGPGPTNADGTPLDAFDSGSSTTSPSGAPPASNGGANGPNGTSPPTTRLGSSPTTSRTHSPAPDAPDSGARAGVGAFARTLLRPQPATRIVVEVLVQAGAEPAQSALDHLVRTLGEVSGKPVSLAGPVSVPGGSAGRRTSAAGIRDMVDRHSRHPQSGSQAVVHLLYLRGEFDEEASVIGAAVRGDTAAVFKDGVRDSGSPLAPARTIEEAVVVHEAGHLLGLVDIVLKTGRADPDNPGHSRNRESVMYWAVESDVVSTLFNGPPPRDFDNDDRADLARLRNGA